MSAKDRPRWWEVRRAQNRKPATYHCPLCGELLPALSDHMLMFPEGDHSRRRHAHTDCVLRARREGRLPTRDEFERAHAPASAPRPARRGALLNVFRRRSAPRP